MVDLKKIKTENRNQNTLDIDIVSTTEILEKINNEDQTIAFAVKETVPVIAKLVDKIVDAMNCGGRLIYIGAGTSGRIGILDAVECPPTYGVSFETVMCLMAGGEKAFIKAVEGAEDSLTMPVDDLKMVNITEKDIIVGIAASGRTPYVIAGIEYAKKIGCLTGCIVTVPSSPLGSIVDYPIEAVTGAEPVTGSTRMKSGTAQKMICNMITTATFIKMGKVYENLMIDVQATNQKLVARSQSILCDATGINMEDAAKYISKYGTVKKALFAILSGIESVEEVNDYLEKTNGHIRRSLGLVRKNG